jgi:hypothetical protein
MIMHFNIYGGMLLSVSRSTSRLAMQAGDAYDTCAC